MKLTESMLRKIIKEEVQAVLNEGKYKLSDVENTAAHQENLKKVKDYEKSEKGLAAIRKDAEAGNLLMDTPVVKDKDNNDVQLDIVQYQNAILPKGSLPNPPHGGVHKIVIALKGNRLHNARRLSGRR